MPGSLFSLEMVVMKNEKEEDEDGEAYEAVAVSRVVTMMMVVVVVLLLLLRGLETERRSPRHPHTHKSDAQRFPSPTRNPSHAPLLTSAFKRPSSIWRVLAQIVAHNLRTHFRQLYVRLRLTSRFYTVGLETVPA